MRLPERCLCLVTDPGFRPAAEFLPVVEAALGAGVDVVQLREKSGADDRTIYERGLAVAALCRRFGVPLIVDDRVDLAMALDADGVHVGQRDLPVEAVRRIWPGVGIIGVSASTPATALAALQAGANYIGAGAVFPTATKADADRFSLPALQALYRLVRDVSDAPVMAIGGIGPDNLEQVLETGCTSIAVVSAVWKAPDPAAIVLQLRAMLSSHGTSDG